MRSKADLGEKSGESPESRSVSVPVRAGSAPNQPRFQSRPDGPADGGGGLAASASRAAVDAGRALRQEQAKRGAGADSPPREGAAGRPRRSRALDQRVVILSGLSGAGKTSATKLFEDLGYTCMDNLPGELLPALAELVSEDRQRFEKVAIVLDVRAGDAPLALAAMRGALEGRGIKPRVVFLEARDEVLIRRFSETRHRHPLAGRRGIAGSIAEERRLLDPVRAESDIVVDTSDLSLRQLKERIFAHLADDASDAGIVFQLISFGFKYGVPSGGGPGLRRSVHGEPVLRRGAAPPVRPDAGRARLRHGPADRTAVLRLPGRIPRSDRARLQERRQDAPDRGDRLHRRLPPLDRHRRAAAGWLEKRGYGTVAVFHRELERE
jgi:shikimate kinase